MVQPTAPGLISAQCFHSKRLNMLQILSPVLLIAWEGALCLLPKGREGTCPTPLPQSALPPHAVSGTSSLSFPCSAAFWAWPLPWGRQRARRAGRQGLGRGRGGSTTSISQQKGMEEIVSGLEATGARRYPGGSPSPLCHFSSPQWRQSAEKSNVNLRQQEGRGPGAAHRQR